MHLVIGASGQVGGALMQALQARNITHCGTYNTHLPPPEITSQAPWHSLDLNDHAAVHALVKKVQPSHIYLPASYTYVDGCEVEPEKSYAVNVEGVKVVAEAANGAKLIYFSSDYVFDGKNGPYGEDDEIHAISVYGEHKVLAEKIVREASPANLITRTTVVYGPEWQQKNFVLRLIKSLSEDNEVPVPDDQIGTPTYNRALAATVVALVEEGLKGTYHVAGSDTCTRYELALAVAFAFGLDSNLVIPISTDLLDQKAARPLLAGLKLDKVRAALGSRAQLTGYKAAIEELRQVVLEQDPEAVNS